LKRKESLNREVKTLSQYEADEIFKSGTVTDANENCISCGGNDKDLWDGGHFKS
jgi:hypothetical protein